MEFSIGSYLLSSFYVKSDSGGSEQLAPLLAHETQRKGGALGPLFGVEGVRRTDTCCTGCWVLGNTRPA